MEDKTILLVEDNPDDITLTLRTLQKNNILNKVAIAHDGLEALDYLSRAVDGECALPVIILLDLNLPKMKHRAVNRES